MFPFLKSSTCSSFSGSRSPGGLHSKKTSPPLYTPFAKHKPVCYKGAFAKITSRNRWQQTRAFHQHLGISPLTTLVSWVATRPAPGSPGALSVPVRAAVTLQYGLVPTSVSWISLGALLGWGLHDWHLCDWHLLYMC